MSVCNDDSSVNVEQNRSIAPLHGSFGFTRSQLILASRQMGVALWCWSVTFYRWIASKFTGQ